MSYANSVSEVLRWARQLVVGTGKADTMQNPDALLYMSDADEIINSMLSPIYAVPLNTITRASRPDIYPDPIPLIAKRLSAGLMIKNVYTEIEPNASARGEEERAQAMDMLSDFISGLVGGTARLAGQRLKSRNRFLPPGVYPNELPAKPATVLGV